MKLSDGEKLIAFMLADIMEAGGIKGDIDPGIVKTAIAGDDVWALQWEYGPLFHNEGPSEQVVEETADIMTMCRVLETAVANLTAEDRASLPSGAERVFVGFDGNEEPHFGVATMLVKTLGRFEEWANRPLNAHTRTIDHYRRMRAKFDEIAMPMHGRMGTKSLHEILTA